MQKHAELPQARVGVPKTKSKGKKPEFCNCRTPYGFCNGGCGTGQRCLHVASAGTTCVDVSRFGSMAGLMGKSCESLSIWLSELALTRPVLCLELLPLRFRRPKVSDCSPAHRVRELGFAFEIQTSQIVGLFTRQ